MCGIAGLIHKGKTVNIGKELQDMLQALKHRGPDSTGFALYGEGNSQGDYIMRFKVGEMLQKEVQPSKKTNLFMTREENKLINTSEILVEI